MFGITSCSKSLFLSSKDKIYIKDIMDKKSFQKIGEFYAKDKNHVYCNICLDETTASHSDMSAGQKRKFAIHMMQYKLIKGADPQAFEVMEVAMFSHDENYVYYAGILIEGADVKSFKPIKPTNPLYSSNMLYSKDDKHAFFRYYKIDGIDLSSFTVASNGNYAYDNKYLYSHLYKEEIDIATFIPGEYSCRDKNYIYNFGGYDGFISKK